MADSSVAVLANIFTAPSLAFAQIKQRPRPWLPLVIIVLGYCAISLVYTQAVDLPWLMDRQLAQRGNLTEEQREAAVEAALRISPTVYGVIGSVTTALTTVVILAMFALYYTGVSFATSDGVKFKQWFAMTVWGALPVVLGLLASLVNLFVVDARFLPQEEMNPLSFGNLLGIDNEGMPMAQRVLLAFDFTVIWVMVLAIIGYHVLSQRSLVRSAVIVLAPWVVLALLGVLAL